MRFQGAVIREQGQTFAVVIVKQEIISHRGEADRTMRGLSSVFPGLPIVLMAQDNQGRPTYYGRTDIARFLASVSLEVIPWREYTIH